jgi:hypothetical protein
MGSNDDDDDDDDDDDNSFGFSLRANYKDRATAACWRS